MLSLRDCNLLTRSRPYLIPARWVGLRNVLAVLIAVGMAATPSTAADGSPLVSPTVAHDRTTYDYDAPGAPTTPTASTHHRRSAPRTRAGGGIAGVDARIALKVATKVGPRGQFSIRNWDDYPRGVPRPTGELRLRTGAEYDRARSTANQANAQLRRSNPDAYRGKQIHEIHPVKFGGSPTDPANKIALTPQEHYRLNSFWMRHQRYAEGGP